MGISRPVGWEKVCAEVGVHWSLRESSAGKYLLCQPEDQSSNPQGSLMVLVNPQDLLANQPS